MIFTFFQQGLYLDLYLYQFLCDILISWSHVYFFRVESRPDLQSRERYLWKVLPTTGGGKYSLWKLFWINSNAHFSKLGFLISSSLSETPTANIRPTPSTQSPGNKSSPSPGSKATPRASIRPMVTPTVPIPTPTATVMPTTQTENQEGKNYCQVKNMKPYNLHGALACDIISVCSGDKFWTFCTALQLHSATCSNCNNQHPDHSVCSANSAASRLQCGHGTALYFIFYWPRQAESCYQFTSFLYCDIQMVVIGT